MIMTDTPQEPTQAKVPELPVERGPRLGGGFMRALQGFLRRKSSATEKAEGEPASAVEPKQKMTKVKKELGLSLLLNKYVNLARSGVTRGSAPLKAAASAPVVEMRTEDDAEKSQRPDAKSGVAERFRMRSKKAAPIGADSPLFSDRSEKSSVETDQKPAEEIGLPEFANDTITDEELSGFIEVPESLLEEAKDLEIMAKSISKEELEEAAQFLGVFKDKGIDLERFKEYVPPEEAQAQSPSGKPGLLGGSLASLTDFVAQQKKLLEVFSSIGSLSFFKGSNAKKLQKLMESVPEDGEIVIQKKQASPMTKPVGNVSEPSDDDPTQVGASSLVMTGAASLEQMEREDDGGLALENLSPAEMQKRRLELDAEAEAIARAPKETIEDIKRDGLGIDLEGVVAKKGASAPSSSMELREEMEQEDFLESTVSTAPSGLPVAPQANLSRAERKALEKQRALQEKEEMKRQKELAKKQQEEEKRWAEEAKRREKLMQKKEEERKKQDKAMAKGDQIKINIKKPLKKQNRLVAFMNSLNYMGMGKERVGFIANLGTMMDAGLPLLDALRSLEMEAKVKPVKKLMNRIITAVELGSPLWRAMEAQYFFQPQQVAMVKVGEEAGNLVENLSYLTIQSEKDEALRGKIKTAMIYPIIIFTMLTAIIMGLGIFVLPNLIQVIYGLGVPLPLVTRGIIMFTNVFQDHGAVIIPGFFGGMVFLGILTKYTSFKVVVQWVMYKVPGIGALLREATLSRFGVIMSGLLQAGLPVTDAIESLANVTPLVRYKKFYYQLLEHIKLGDSFRSSFKKIKLTDKCFPTSVQQLVITGEQSGSLAKIMGKIADIHDKRASDIAEKLPVILEPMLLLFIGSLVGTIALGILAPIYSIVGNIG